MKKNKAKSKNKTALSSCFFVSRNVIRFYEYNSADVVEIKLSSEIIFDLEIVSQTSLERVLKTWMEQLKITPGNTALLLDDSVYFYKNINKPSVEMSDVEVTGFLETVPFADLDKRLFATAKASILTVVSQDLLRPLVEAIESLEFKVLIISPAFVLGVDFSKNAFSKEIAQSVLEKMELLTKYSFISPAEMEEKLTEEQPFMSIQITPKVIAMGVVFILLILVLVALLIMQSR